MVQKRAYLEEAVQRARGGGAAKADELLSGNDWYNTQAWRAVNQASTVL